jgi:hypothetical protein
MGLNRCCVATEAPELDEFLGGRGMVVLSFGQILNGAISARCGHFIHCLYHMIPNLHIYYIIIPHFLLHMITSIANSNLFSNTRLICSVQ